MRRRPDPGLARRSGVGSSHASAARLTVRLAEGGSVDVSGLRRGAVRLLPGKRGRAGGVDLRRARRRLAVQRGDRPGAARAGLGAADRALVRPARPAAGARCSPTRASRPPTRSRPTGRRRSASSASTPRGCPPTSSTTTARPTPASPRPTCRRSGPEVSGLHFGSYSLAAAPVADAMAALARGEPRPLHLGRSERAPDGRARHGRLARAAGGAVPARRRGEDQRRGPRAALARPLAARRSPPTSSARASRLVVVTEGGEAALGWTASGLHAAAAPPRVTVIDTVGAGDTFQAALLARLLRGSGPAGGAGGARRGRPRGDPRLRRPGGRHHLLAARRGPAARRRADRLKDDDHGFDRHPRGPLRPGDLRRHRRSRAAQDPAEPVPPARGAPDALRLADRSAPRARR